MFLDARFGFGEAEAIEGFDSRSEFGLVGGGVVVVVMSFRGRRASVEVVDEENNLIGLWFIIHGYGSWRARDWKIMEVKMG